MRIKPALTLIELVLVISIISLLSVGALYAFSTARQNYALKLSGDSVAHQLTRAHIYARENKNEESWGVKILDSKNYTLTSRDGITETTHFQFSLPDPVRFTPGVSEVWFDQVTGETENSVTLVIESPSGKTKQINVSRYGQIGML